MARGPRFTEEQLKQLGRVQNEKGDYVPVSSLVAKGKVEKLLPLIDRMAVAQLQIDYANRKIRNAVNNLPPNPNAKIKGAVKVEVDGVKFDSKLEAYMHKLLTGAGIRFVLQKKYVLQDKFRYNGEAIREIGIVVDFELIDHNIIIDTKGFQLRDGMIKYKLLKWHLANMPGEHPKIEMPSTKEECDLLLNRILFDNHNGV